MNKKLLSQSYDAELNEENEVLERSYTTREKLAEGLDYEKKVVKFYEIVAGI